MAGDAGPGISAGPAAAAGVGVVCLDGACLVGFSSDFMKSAAVTIGITMHVRITANVVKPDDDDGSVLSPGS